ncbi:zinc finger protein 292 [Pleurodeles waltl]|uniref:zinc finger protein 292 n=1 Tax=Pleurodeles waltl TaxID=8319 RepID=UPI003709807E
MADEEAEQESGGGRPGEPPGLGERLRALEEALRRSEQPADKAASEYCQRFCQTLLEFAEKWKTSEDHLPLLQVYTDAIESYSKARAYLTAECENVPVVLERLALSCVELLLGLPHDMPEKHWKGFQTAVQGSHQRLVENGNLELHFLHTLSQEKGVWKNPVLHSILHEEPVGQDKVNEFLALEAPILLEMRIKHLLKASQITQATILAKLCSDNQDLRAKGNFKQIYLVCLCSQSPNLKLIEEIAKMDCKDALEMICNLESEGDEKTALIICAAFLSRQLQLGDMDCAWELTLFWSKLQQRVDPSVQVYLERCRQLSLLTKTVYHIFFLIKIIQSEAEGAGLSTCIELCVKALRLESGENANVKISICKTISCLLPDDLEVKRACQLSEFLLEPTVDAYYAVEMLYNQPDQKYDEDSLPVPNSLRCELLLVLKTRWPFDPEFWDWKTLKRQCLALMGEEASIVSSIDELNDSEVYEKLEDSFEERKENTTNGISNSYSSSVLLRDMEEEKRKKREVKKMREKGFVSARFRNFQAYMQYCVLCDKEFLGHRIIRHAQKHHSDGVYSCPICAKKFDNKERLVPHVTLHVKQSSKERLDEMKPLRRLGRSQKLAITSEKQNSIFKPDQRSVKKNNIYSDDFVTFDDNEGSEDENCVKFKQDDTNITSQKLSDEPEFTCPVLVCKKGFKHYKNLIVHVKAHKDNEEAMHFLEMQSKKVICHYCRRHFVSVTHLNDHLQIHCGSKPYMCIQMKCGASFRSNAQLVAHKKEHQDFRAKCMFPKCGRIFSEACTLYEHEAKHYHTFTCKFKDCGKVYYSESQLESHMNSHELKQGNTLKDQESASEMYDPTLNEAKDTKNIPLKSEQIYNPNFVSSASAESESLKPIKMESFEEQQTWPNRLEHTALGTVSQQLPPSKEISNSVLPSAGISKVMSPQTNVPEQMLGQSSVDALEKADVTVSSSHIKKSPLSQGICDIILTQGKLAAAVNMIDTGNTLLSQIYTAVKDACNDSSLPLFQESKEVECFSQPQQELNVSVNSGTSKIDLAMKTVERQMGTVVHLGVDNQPLYETSFVFPEFEDRMKTANLLNLPSKTSNGSLFVSSQSSLSNPLVTSSVLKQLPLQKFTCLIEGCTRIYNSIQSIGKHMKAAHPQQYPSFTQERKRRKRQRSRNSANAKALLNMSPKASCSNNAVSPHNKSSNANHSFSSEFHSVQPPVFPTHLETLVNPMLAALENMNQGAQHNKSAPGAFFNTQFEDLSKSALPLKFENDSDPFLPIPAEDCSISNFSSLSLNVTNPVFSQLGNNANHELLSNIESTTESIFPKQEYSGVTSSEFNFGDSSLPSSDMRKDGHGHSPNTKERRHSSRSKCPAIIQDGKFICRRCFRVFSNPSSLGGHLSKGSLCKPINDETEISEEHLNSSGQVSLLAGMMLSSNLQSQPSLLTPETCYKEPTYLQSLAVESHSSYLQNLLTHSNAANLTACVQEKNEIIKQALETAGIPGTLENTETLPQVTATNCALSNSTVNAMILPCPSLSPLLDSSCNPTTLMVDKSKILSSNSEQSKCPTFSSDLLNNFEGGICSHAVTTPQCIPSNSCRVSVISGPLSTVASQTDARDERGSSSRKKTVDPFIETNLTQNFIASDLLTAMGNLAKDVKESAQKPSGNLPQNLNSNCDAHLIKTITDKLKNVDHIQTCIDTINENFKPSSGLPHLVPQSSKVEKDDCINLNNQTSEGKVDVLKTNNTLKNNLDVRSSIQNVTSNSVQQGFSINCDSLLENDFSKIVTSETNQIPDCSADCSFSTKSSLLEKTHVDDEKILEILQRLQCLRLENDSAVDGLESDASASPPSGISSPLTSISFVASKGGCGHQAPETDICNSLLDETVKPFVCREKTCDYRAMSKDALFKHYRRVHKYTEDILMDIKKNHLKFAPFRCVIPDCPKTFTRNSNLRAHCQSVHHFSTEEMEKLRFKRPYELSLCEGMITPPRSDGQKRRQVQIENELKTEPPPLVIQTPMKKEFDQNTYEQISSDQESRVGLTIRKQENLPKLASLLQEQRKKEALRKKMRKQMKAREERLQKMRLENDGTLPAKYSPYRPYRCVHQDCFAAFTIQQNLILHYQAMHSSDLPTFGLQLEDENETYKDVHDEIESSQIGKEFRCQEYDCSRIFQEVASLIQHYMKLHEMFPEEIEQVMSVTNTGKFKCDQPQCISSFTTCSNYLAHLETHHGVKIRQCGEDGIYKCDCEGCDRIYATRSNLLRHIYSKHNERHKAHLMRPRRFLQDDEENNSSKANEDRQMRYKPHELQYDSFGNEKMRKKNPEFENDMSEINRNLPVSPLKYGKKFLFLKTKYDALAECSDSLPKQYPCMIKGCTSIVTSEHNIIRHYKCHKITRAFTLTHRATLIICKKLHVCRLKASASDDETARRKRKELKGSAMSSSESSDESVSQLSEIEKDEVDELAELLHTKLFNEDSDAAENQARTTSIKNREIKKACSHPGKQGSNNILKRVHRQKLASQNKKRKIEKSEEKLAAEIRSIQSGEETISSETADEPLPVIDLSSFKPMGFEMSFLKFLEESAVKEKKKTKRDCTGLKTDLHLNLAKSSQEAASEDDGSGETSSEEEGSEKFTRKKPSLIDYHSCPITDCENLIQFANPSHLQCIGIVRFVLDERLNNCFELAFKQLQEMRPTVVLKKVDMHCDGEIITSEQSCYVERNFDVAH